MKSTVQLPQTNRVIILVQILILIHLPVLGFIRGARSSAIEVDLDLPDSSGAESSSSSTEDPSLESNLSSVTVTPPDTIPLVPFRSTLPETDTSSNKPPADLTNSIPESNLIPDHDEPDGSCDNATVITTTQTSTSYISHPNDEDYYVIEVTEPFVDLIITLNAPLDYSLDLLYNCTSHCGFVRNIDKKMGSEQRVYKVGSKTGAYYIRVSSPDGAYSSTPYTLQADIQPTDREAAQTLILVNQSRLETFYGEERTSNLLNRLNTLANHPAVEGVIIQVDQYPDVSAAYDLWDEHPSSTSRANEVSTAIKNLLTNYLDRFPTVQKNGHLVIVGDDRIIPARRAHVYNYENPDDSSWVPESHYAAKNLYSNQQNTISAALFDDQTLTDDFYADFTPSSMSGANNRDLYIPDLAIGRLVEEPEEMMAVIDAFLAKDGRVTLNSGAVSGYSFIRDVGQNECNTLTNDGLNMDCSLIGSDFSGDDLTRVMLYTNPQIAAINGHATHHQHLADDSTAMDAADILNTTADLSGDLFYAVGSQSGLNVPPNELDALDLAQAFASRGATYVANTGWGYGLEHSIGLSEKLMAIFTENITEGSSATIGDALTKAKQQYKLFDHNFDYYDEKSMIQVTLFGLPQWQLETPEQNDSNETLAEVSSSLNVSRTLWVSPTLSASLSVMASEYEFPALKSTVTEDGTYYTISDPALSNPLKPIQPMSWDNLESSVGRAHGVLMLGGMYSDESNFDPVIEGAGDLSSRQESYIPEPEFTSQNFYPALPHQFNDIVTLGDQSEEMLVISVGQYDSGSQTARLFDNLAVEVYYSNSYDRRAPDIGTLRYAYDGNKARLTIPVTDTNGLHRVVGTYTTGSTEDQDGNWVGEWRSIDLTLNSDGAWSGSIPVQHTTSFFIQAVDNVGNVAVDHNNGAYYRLLSPEASSNRTNSQEILSDYQQDDTSEIWRRDDADLIPSNVTSTKPEPTVSDAYEREIYSKRDIRVMSHSAHYYYRREYK